MSPIGLGATLGIGAGRSATSSGKPSGGAPWTNLKSIQCDGTNDKVVAISSVDYSGAFTFSFWFKATGTAPSPNISYPNVYTTGTGGSRTVVMRVGTTGAGATGQIASTGWTHNAWNNLVVTRDDSDDVECFRNGTSVGTSNSPRILKVSRFCAGLTSDYFAGFVDEIATWGEVLSESDRNDIRSGADAGTTGTPSDLNNLSATPDHWWRCGDGSDGVDPITGELTTYDVGSATAVNMELDNGAAFVSDVPS